MRTVKVRGGHLGPDGTLVKPLQQEPMLGPLVVPVATLDSELQPINDANDASVILLGVELLNMQCIV